MRYLLLSYAYQFDYPLLGICRGMQMINVFFGARCIWTWKSSSTACMRRRRYPCAGKIEACKHQSGARVNRWQTKEYGHPTRTVSIMRSSKLGEILGCDSAAVNSMHHPGRSCAASQFGGGCLRARWSVEGVEAKDCRFLMGVRWHPECCGGRRCMTPLFRL